MSIVQEETNETEKRDERTGDKAILWYFDVLPPIFHPSFPSATNFCDYVQPSLTPTPIPHSFGTPFLFLHRESVVYYSTINCHIMYSRN